MKENLRDRIIVFLILCFTVVNGNAQRKENKEVFYTFLDNFLEKFIASNNENKIDDCLWFVEINIVKKCDRNIFFSFNSVYLLPSIEQDYYVYNYKNNLIIYRVNPKEKSRKIKFFFNQYLKKTNYNINLLPKEGEVNGHQSIINGVGLLYFEDKLYTKSSEFELIEKYCE
ncbi:hypothetical protein [Apibacter sp. HY039]|uniref:hypothetical protein n=1 Tax=Apibacter sp. HY039 TaxID=2501476 RepID=UPI000FEBF80C|nr:hypothetical protein [Apibacter sp. HY039]